MRYNIYALDGAQQIKYQYFSFDNINDLNAWLRNPKMPSYYDFAWKWDDLSQVLVNGGIARLGRGMFNMDYGLADSAAFWLEVLTD